MRWLAILTVLVATGARCVLAVEASDDMGRRIELMQPATRIVALAPNLAEMVDAAGAAAKLVGVSSHTEYPVQARALPAVASAGSINFEAIIRLRPELVLAWASGNPSRAIARLAERGIPVFIAEPRTLADLARLVRTIGELAGSPTVAEQSAERFEREIAALPRSSRPVPVFIEVWHVPLITVNGRHLISDLLSRCGAVNVFANAPVLTPTVSVEQLLAARPALIIANGGAAAIPGASARWDRARLVPAVQSGRIVAIDPGALHAQSLRLIEGARSLCTAIAAV